MKPTKAQCKVCEAIIREVKWWATTNDINSPTHFNDLHDCLFADTEQYLTPDDRDELEGILTDVLIFIRNMTNDR